jgi:hypothetical protein
MSPFLWSRWPLILDAADTPKAKQALFDLVDDSLKRLEAKLLAYREIAAKLAASRARRLASDCSPEAERLKRYELANARRAHRCMAAFYTHRRETEGDEDRGRRAEDGGEGFEAENATDSSAELGVAGGESELVNKNLTTEANGSEIGAEADSLKEVEALRTLLVEARAEYTATNQLGIGPIGARVAGGGNGRSAIESAIFAGRPLLPPIS